MTIEAPVTPGALKERSAAATRRLCETLRLESLTPKDLSYLALALTEAAAQEAESNTAFNQRLRELYHTLTPPKKVARGSRPEPTIKRPTQEDLTKPLQAIGTVDPSRIRPYAPPDPYALLDLYGAEQLPLSLFRYTLDSLKRTVPIVQARHPGTRPTNMGRKDSIVEYVMRYVTEPDAVQSQVG